VTPVDPTSRASPEDARKLVGTVLVGRYDVREVLGVGGKGIVYEAFDRTMARTVAIKVPILTSEDTIKRFLREGRAGSAVAHPNVCAIYDFGPLEDGTPFLVMEHLVGETLAERLVKTPKLALPDAVVVVRQVLAGLSAAHARGIVHRDIKPGNIFFTHVTGDERVAKILDFGASTLDPAHAKREEDFESLTKIGTAIGTPIYMAPEQVRGQRDLDGRVDVYACGVILYEALTGIPPFMARKRSDLFRLIVAGHFTPAGEVDPSLPEAVDAVLAHAMATRRRDRYPAAEAFASALESLRLEALKLTRPTPMVLPDDDERMALLRDRVAQLSSMYLSSDSQSGLRAAKRASTLDIPVHYEDDESPETTRDPFGDDDEASTTRRD
jgi:eukaryotic-like serine/threonine-protein kinase